MKGDVREKTWGAGGQLVACADCAITVGLV